MNTPPLLECDISCAVFHIFTVNVKECMRIGKGSERLRKKQAPYTSTFQKLFCTTPSHYTHIPHTYLSATTEIYVILLVKILGGVL